MIRETQDVSKVDKPGESTVAHGDVESIPERDVTYEDLEQSGENPEEWLQYGNNYRRHHHSTAEAITPDNVSDLEREWEITADDLDEQPQTGMQGTSLVVAGDPPIMYQTNGAQTVRAINARTGEMLWRYRYEPRSGFVETRPPASRGTAVLGDTLYYATLDLGLVALDRYTADEKWYYNGAYEYRGETIDDFQGGRWMGDDDPDTAMHPELSYVKDRGSSSAFPPMVHDGVILKGSFGGERGVAGWAEGIPTEDRLAEMETPTPTPEGTPTETPEGTPTETPEGTPTETPEGTPEPGAAGTTYEFGGEVGGWVGRSPGEIEGEQNPTLELEAGVTYEVIWENVDGAPHDFTIQDDQGEDIAATETMDDQGATRTLTFEASPEMTTYICTVHPNTMIGDIEVTGEATATAQETEDGETPTGTPEPGAKEGTETPAETETPAPEETPSDEALVGGEHNNPVWLTRMTPPDDWVGESWKHGGATVWQAGALDLETGMAVLPTGNPAPWFGTVRPGWNPYSAGKVAVDYQSGEVQWNFQEVPHDWWDYDSPSPAIIYDAEVAGEERTLASWPGKTAWVFTMDIESGQLVERSVPFTEHLNMFDLPAKNFDDAEWIMPHLIGGTDPQPSTYDPNTRTMVLKGYNNPMKLTWEPIEYTLNKDYKGMDVRTASQAQRDQIDGWDEPIGNVTAMDPVTGQIKWQNWYDTKVWGGALSTATGVTFAGVSDGTFYAYDTESGDVLWEDEIGPGVDGNPVSWVDPETNKQYLYIQAGGTESGGGEEIVTYSMEMESDSNE